MYKKNSDIGLLCPINYRKKALHIMRITILLFFAGIFSISATGYSQEARVTIQVKDKCISDIITEIKAQTNYSFWFDVKDVNVNRKVSIDAKNETLKDVLLAVFEGEDIDFQLQENHIILTGKRIPDNNNTLQQSRKIVGVVKDRQGESIIGANIVIKGTTLGTTTDIDGKYSLEVNDHRMIVISYIGFLTQEINIAGKTEVNITLEENMTSLDEVIVVGYGVQKKALSTGATINLAGEELQKMSTTNPFTALQSQTPGVTIMQANGQPGSDYIVNIRGISTNGDARPLYVIDGVPSGNNALNNMSIADIESVDILKDAASSAIYGARAANGVVLITTKQGKSGRARVSYDGYFGKQYMYRKPELLNAKQYMQVQDELNASQNQEPYDWKSLLPTKLYNDIQSGAWEGTDWLDAFYCPGATTTGHAFTLTGGNEMSKFSLGYSFTLQDGIFGEAVQSNYTRHTFRLNSDHVIYKAGGLDVIKLGENLNYTYRLSNGVNVGNLYSNQIRDMLVANPLLPVYNENGEYYDVPMREADGWYADPLANNPIGFTANSASGLNLTKNYSLNASVYLEVQPIKDLLFKSLFSYRQNASSGRGSNQETRMGGRSENENIYWTAQQSASSGFNWSVSNTLSYAFEVNNNNFSVMLGQEIEKSGYGESVSVNGRRNNFELGFDYAYISNLKKAIELDDLTASGSPLGKNAMASFFGRVMWNYKETYMANVILRADGSSNFARGNRWGYFPSVSVGWLITNESFMESTKSWMDYLKLRISWGQNGNASVAGFQYLSTFRFPADAAYYFGSDKKTQSTGSAPGVLKNENISWETSQQTDIGLDMRFLDSRLGVTFDYYIKETKDWLLEAPIAATWGYSAPNVNGGDVRNSGVELSLTWNEHRGDFFYSVNLNGSYNKNKVLRIDNAEGIIYGRPDVLCNPISEIYRMQESQPMGFFYGWVHDGVFQNQAEIDAYVNSEGNLIQPEAQSGDIRFRDLDGNGVIDINDKTKIGCGWPVYRAGLSINVGYKGFDFIVSASGAFGHELLKSYRSFAGRRYENFTTDVFDHWTGEGTDNFHPRLTIGTHPNYTNFSELLLESGDYVKIQNITLGYDFKRILGSMPFSKARLYVTGQNLLTFTHYSGMDPEVGYGDGQSWVAGIDQGYYPNSRTYLMGVQLSF